MPCFGIAMINLVPCASILLSSAVTDRITVVQVYVCLCLHLSAQYPLIC